MYSKDICWVLRTAKWRENPARHVTLVQCVFVALGLATSPETAGPQSLDIDIDVDVICSRVDCYNNFEDMNANSAIRVERRLKENLAFWKNIGASRWLLEIIEQGYCFPFIDLPAERQFPNHKIWGLFVGEQRLPQVLCIHCPATLENLACCKRVLETLVCVLNTHKRVLNTRWRVVGVL